MMWRCIAGAISTELAAVDAPQPQLKPSFIRMWAKSERAIACTKWVNATLQSTNQLVI